MQVVAIVHDAGDFCGEADRRAFQLTAGQSDGPGIEPLDGLGLRWSLHDRRWPEARRPTAGLRIGGAEQDCGGTQHPKHRSDS